MDTDVPYMVSSKNVSAIFDKIQNAGAPQIFGLDFLKDLGFTSSNDRGVIKVLKFLGFLDSSGKPQSSYREFMDQSKARTVLASRIRVAYDDLFTSDKNANAQSADKLKGWFKTKTGASDAVAKKIATTFKTLATYADFSKSKVDTPAPIGGETPIVKTTPDVAKNQAKGSDERTPLSHAFGLTYRIEVHLPDTTNVDTFRSIFRAIREELLT
jgi:hypothetical protein